MFIVTLQTLCLFRTATCQIHFPGGAGLPPMMRTISLILVRIRSLALPRYLPILPQGGITVDSFLESLGWIAGTGFDKFSGFPTLFSIK